MKVNIKNYQAIKNANLEFLPGITVIVGSSNNGKSSIIRSIQGAINNQGGTKFINYDADACEVSIEENDNSITWIKSKKQGKSAYIINGQEMSKIGQKQIEDVADVLNMRQIEINLEKVRLNFWKQLEYPFLVGKNSYQLFDFISRSKEQETVTALEQSVESDKKLTAGRVSTLSTQIDSKKSAIGSYTKELESLSIANDFEADMLEKRIAAYNAVSGLVEKHKLNSIAINNIKSQVLEKQILVDAISSKVSVLSENMANYKEIKELLDLYSIRKSRLNVVKQNIVESQAIVDAKSTIVLSLEAIIKKIKETVDIKDSISSMLKATKENIALISHKKTLIDALNTKIKAATDKLDEFKFCPMCNQPLKNHEVNHE